MNHIGPLNFSSIHVGDHSSGETDERAEFIKKIPKQVRNKFLKQREKHKKVISMGRKLCSMTEIWKMSVRN